MQGLSYSQIQKALGEANFEGLPSYSIAVLRNIMVEAIDPYLSFSIYRMGFRPVMDFGEYDNIWQEAVGGQGDLLGPDTDCVMVFMKLDSASWDLARRFPSLTRTEIDEETTRVKRTIVDTVHGIRKQTDAMILWHGFEVPPFPAFGIRDSQSADMQVGTIRDLNRHLLETLRQTQNAYFVDMELSVARVGVREFYDHRYWHIGRAPFSLDAMRDIASVDFQFIRAQKGKSRKCLVLDCDNTLWGGVVGEDGLSGIKLDRTHPGSAYYEFQQEIVNLYNRGVIVALCSKNNEEDVWEVFDKHPSMVLKREHISAAAIGWRDKATMLREIAAELNIDLDSLVFVDDSEFEINLVRELLPAVETACLLKNMAVQARDFVISCGLFDTPTVSEEDRHRGQFYRDETERKEFRSQCTDLTSYLRSLEMVAEVSFADEFSIPRLAQQTQKTNQFNLTTRRYSEADISRFAASQDADVIYVKLSDRFGESGIVGTCLLRYQGETAIIDTLLLSCRVLGRGVEDVFLAEALRAAKRRGCRKAIGEYFRTRKNHQVERFYDKHGFTNHNGSETREADRTLVFDLTAEIGPVPDYFKTIKSQLGDAG